MMLWRARIKKNRMKVMCKIVDGLVVVQSMMKWKR